MSMTAKFMKGLAGATRYEKRPGVWGMYDLDRPDVMEKSGLYFLAKLAMDVDVNG